MEQPRYRPASWQVNPGKSLGYLLVLSPNELKQPSARLALNHHQTIIGSSTKLATICLEEPDKVQDIHLIINIHKNHRASLQVVGATGITLNHLHLQPSPEQIQLNDRDTFYINQFPFRWEQCWDYHLVDWSRFSNQLEHESDQQPNNNNNNNNNNTDNHNNHTQTLLLDITPEKQSPRSSSPKLLISPTKTNQEFSFQWEHDSHVSFRRPSSNKTSIDSHRSRAHSPIVADQSSEDEDEDQLLTRRTTELVNNPPSPPHEPNPSQPPRLKSLLQNLLIKQAVQVHLAHQTNLADQPAHSAVASGFSSSEDEDDDDQEDDPDSTDDELLGHPTEPTDTRMTSSPAKESQSIQPNPTCIDPSDTISPDIPPPLCPVSDTLQPISLPSTLARPSSDRRSVSPNAQLLSAFQSGCPLPPSPPKPLVFPLKSSFRRQSYSAHELAAFSPPPSTSTSTSPHHHPNTTSPSSSSRSVRLNTQMNSRSPSFTVDPHPPSNPEAFRDRLRSSVRATPSTLPSLSSSSPPTPPPPPSPPHAPLVPQPENTTPAPPHRIIRTPRSFLIKRRGSLTPLTAPVCNTLSLPIEKEDYEYANLDDEKRKVRFDQDVFCLEFDQLPEELPLSRQPKRAKVLEEEEHDNRLDRSKQKAQRRNTFSGNRPRRQSPRLILPTSAPHLTIQEEDSSDPENNSKLEEKACSTLASVDLSCLSLNNPPPSSEPDTDLLSGSHPAADPHLSSSSSAVEEEDQQQQLHESKRPSRRGSIIEALTARLFPSSTILPQSSTCVEPDLKRRRSVPADFGRMEEVAKRLNKLTLTKDSLSVDSSDHPLLLRPHSAPSSSSFIVPSLPIFSPSLVGVKQLFFGSGSGPFASGRPTGSSIGIGFNAFVNRFRASLSHSSEADSSSSSSSSSGHDDRDDDDGDDDGDDEQRQQVQIQSSHVDPINPTKEVDHCSVSPPTPDHDTRADLPASGSDSGATTCPSVPIRRRGPMRKPTTRRTPIPVESPVESSDKSSGNQSQTKILIEPSIPKRPRGRPPKSRLPSSSQLHPLQPKPVRINLHKSHDRASHAATPLAIDGPTLRPRNTTNRVSSSSCPSSSSTNTTTTNTNTTTTTTTPSNTTGTTSKNRKH